MIKPSNLGQLVGIEPLALIGHIEKEGERVLVTSLPHRAPATEAYRMLRTNLRFASVAASESLQTLLVTSSGPSETRPRRRQIWRS